MTSRSETTPTYPSSSPMGTCRTPYASILSATRRIVSDRRASARSTDITSPARIVSRSSPAATAWLTSRSETTPSGCRIVPSVKTERRTSAAPIASSVRISATVRSGAPASTTVAGERTRAPTASKSTRMVPPLRERARTGYVLRSGLAISVPITFASLSVWEAPSQSRRSQATRPPSTRDGGPAGPEVTNRDRDARGHARRAGSVTFGPGPLVSDPRRSGASHNAATDGRERERRIGVSREGGRHARVPRSAGCGAAARRPTPPPAGGASGRRGSAPGRCAGRVRGCTGP